MAVDKARFAFGSSANIQAGIDAGKIDNFDVLLLDGDTDNPKIGWIDKNGKIVIVKNNAGVSEDDVVVVDALPAAGEAGIIYICQKTLYIWDGAAFVAVSESTDLSALLDRVSAAEAQVSALGEQVAAVEGEVAKKADAEEVEAKIGEVEAKLGNYVLTEYVVSHKPVGTLVDYRDKEVRIMCPADTAWTLQQSGAGSDADKYYIGVKAYAPSDDVVSFKEDIADTITDTNMYYFEGNDFAGVEDDGRKYSIIWLPVAVHDATANTWTYYGANSSEGHYVGWYYSVEWYDANGVAVASDCVKINLSNEDCHSNVEPYYIAEVTAEIKAYTDEQIEAKIEEVTEIPVVEF